MRIELDKIPSGLTEEALIREINKRLDLINMMLLEIDEDNLSHNILNQLKGDKNGI